MSRNEEGFPTFPDAAWEAREDARRDAVAEEEERRRLRETYGRHALRSRRSKRSRRGQ